MTVTDLMRMTALATLVVTSATSGATAQTTEADPHRLNAILAQATPGQAPSVQPARFCCKVSFSSLWASVSH